MATLYWHDYETWGIDPSIDRPSQFAGVRTDESLNIISEPLVQYCKPVKDILPHAEACLVTGITPQDATLKGLPEAEFIKKIHAELSTPGTIGVGYNSLRFDDEVTRFTLFRNFYDPYEREWSQGCGRWDIIDMVRCCYALRPEGIEWPELNGKPTFKLEYFTQANGITHASAHDAYSDVEATINAARLIKNKQPGLYDYIYQMREKSEVAALIDTENRKPLLHVSSKFSSEHGCTSLIVPLARHPKNKNAVIVYDLSVDPGDLIKLDTEALIERVFCRQEDLAEGQQRVPLKLIHLNKCPVLATPKLMDEKTARRLKIDKSLCEKHWRALLQHDLSDKVSKVMTGKEFESKPEAEQRLYESFIPKRDLAIMADLRNSTPDELRRTNFVFTDSRLNQMVLYYKARNYPETLSHIERNQWREFCYQRLEGGGEAVQSVSQLVEKVNEIRSHQNLGTEKLQILDDLKSYALDTLRVSESEYGEIELAKMGEEQLT